MHILLLDNFDSFTYNLLDYLQQAGVTVTVRRNNVSVEELKKQHFDGIVLSPGPGTPSQAGCLMQAIAEYHQEVPMLGVCLGHQAIGQFFGANVVRATRPMHGKVSEIRCAADDPLFTDLPRQFIVTRYHSLTLSGLPPELVPLAYTNDEHRELMALRHRTQPLYGVQFHPEALLTTQGLALLRNWVNYCIIAKDARVASADPMLSVI
ncbi:anthranilate synthase component II [Hymenobacter crusticola]|uniref:Aminodeoxychorismate/anthranilate synthase component II n=1 Tax=Hymenobacter crusticola TaxID=1770526 RepID=A0A243WE69_9BACT|nr:aminodeoxychorismate/anthranilate synthase component II [Hymenobacter crusticola]OUJ73902.1 aminodeoxychorismate/anthranilate synthase component II [Hymenobacter crusticola]